MKKVSKARNKITGKYYVRGKQFSGSCLLEATPLNTEELYLIECTYWNVVVIPSRSRWRDLWPPCHCTECEQVRMNVKLLARKKTRVPKIFKPQIGWCYAYTDRQGEKVIGRFNKNSAFTGSLIDLFVTSPSGRVLCKRVKVKHLILDDKWATVQDIPRHAPPRDVLPSNYERQMARYATKAGGQRLVKGVKLTPAVIARMRIAGAFV